MADAGDLRRHRGGRAGVLVARGSSGAARRARPRGGRLSRSNRRSTRLSTTPICGDVPRSSSERGSGLYRRVSSRRPPRRPCGPRPLVQPRTEWTQKTSINNTSLSSLRSRTRPAPSRRAPLDRAATSRTAATRSTGRRKSRSLRRQPCPLMGTNCVRESCRFRGWFDPEVNA